MNMNKLAEEVTKQEGKKVNLSIAQVKEVIKLTLQQLKKLSFKELMDIFKKIR